MNLGSYGKENKNLQPRTDIGEVISLNSIILNYFFKVHLIRYFLKIVGIIKGY